MSTNRRIFYVKCCLVLVALYVFAYIFTNNRSSDFIRELQQSGRSLAALDRQLSGPEVLDRQQSGLEALERQQSGLEVAESGIVVGQSVREPLAAVIPTDKEVEDDSAQKDYSFTKTTQEPVPSALDRVRVVTKCLDKPMTPKIQQRGDYWVTSEFLYNLVCCF